MVREAAEEWAMKYGSSHMDTSFHTSLESQAPLNCPRNVLTVTGSASSEPFGFIFVFMRLDSLVRLAANFPF